MREATITLKDTLAGGLSPNNNPRNQPFLTEMTGMFVDRALETVETFSPMTLPDGIDFSFPYPQLFVLSDLIILCNDDQIWEWGGSSWVSKISSLTTGTTWTCIDRRTYIILSNMEVTVVRDPNTGLYSLDTDLPAGSYGDFNGQLCVGSPKTFS